MTSVLQRYRDSKMGDLPESFLDSVEAVETSAGLLDQAINDVAGRLVGHVSNVNPCLLFLSVFKRVMF